MENILILEVIFKLINELPGTEEWINNALLLLAKNYLAREDMFQAQHINGTKKETQDVDILNKINLILTNNFNNQYWILSLIQMKHIYKYISFIAFDLVCSRREA